MIEVEDTGTGIAVEDQERIFNPFVQLGREAGRKGTGLGLTITRQFVELMGGAIRVDSMPVKGSKFRVEVPVKPSGIFGTGAARPGETTMARLAPGQPECRVLIVEDQEENRQLLYRLLTQAGFQVRAAENGAEGVKIFQSWRPRFVWMDWRMPVMDGLEATRRIRTLEGGREVKIVALSASVLKEEQEQVLAAGADDFEPKPLQFGRIYDCMTRLLGVRFIFDGTLPPGVSMRSPSGLDCEALAALPSLLRTELTEALVSLNTSRIAELIRSVFDLNPALGGDLEYHANRFQYTLILRGLQSSYSNEPGKESAI
jgi:CheY-like chemotaxis protein